MPHGPAGVVKYRILYAGSAKCGQTARIEIYIYIYRKFVPVVRLGWLAPARQLSMNCNCVIQDHANSRTRLLFFTGYKGQQSLCAREGESLGTRLCCIYSDVWYFCKTQKASKLSNAWILRLLDSLLVKD